MLNKKFNTVILASASPRRLDILQSASINPTIIIPKCTEILPENIEMQDAVMFLALKKALWAEEYIKEKELEYKKSLIIAADTVVYYNKIIGKPKDKSDAFDILNTLRSNVHYVATGVALINTLSYEKRVFCDVTKVFFKDYSDEELKAYLETDEPYDKAGAYAIQGTFSKYIDHIEGDLNNVIGLPLYKTLEEINKL
ncbi:MAG: Maf family protein [Eubacteriales bacterium]|nr:Maf family protein [Eubacteriales bacterium]